MLTILSIFDERVPMLDVDVLTFIIGVVAFVIIAAICFWVWRNFRGGIR